MRDSIRLQVNSQLPNPGGQLRVEKRKWFLRNQRKYFTEQPSGFSFSVVKSGKTVNPLP